MKPNKYGWIKAELNNEVIWHSAEKPTRTLRVFKRTMDKVWKVWFVQQWTGKVTELGTYTNKKDAMKRASLYMKNNPQRRSKQ